MKSAVSIVLFTLFLVPIVANRMEGSISYSSERNLLTRRARVGLNCIPPEFLLPATKNLVRSYLRGRVLTSSFLRDFLWLAPENESYAMCLACEFNRPNDPFWETEFALSCEHQEESLWATEGDQELLEDLI